MVRPVPSNSVMQKLHRTVNRCSGVEGPFSPGNSGDDGQLIRQLQALLREHRLDLVVKEGLYTSPAGFTSWSYQ